MGITTRSLARVGTIVLLGALTAGTGLAHAAAPDITGTEGNDRLAGTTAAENIYGLGGGDDIDGGGGGDRIYGGEGDDIVYSQRNTEQAKVYGENGDDEVVGWRFDKIYGGAGDDTLYFWEQREGASLANCGPGFDTLYLTRRAPRVVKIKQCERVRTVRGDGARFSR